MRARLIIALAPILLLAACAQDDPVFGNWTTVPASSVATSGVTTSTSEATTTTEPDVETTTTAAPTLRWAWNRLGAEGSVFGGEGDQDVSQVVVGGTGLVAVGSEWMGDDFDAAVWTSPDGLTWTRVPHDEAIFGGPDYQRLRAVVAGGPGLVAVGYDGSGGDWDAAVWTSSDGLTWARVPHDEAGFGGTDRQGMILIVAGGPGFVAGGFDQSGGDWDVAFWTSADGVAWSRVPHDESLFGGADDQYLDGLVVGGPGLVGVGSDYASGEGEVAVWSSAGGSEWTRGADQSAFGGSGDQWMSWVLAGGPGLVAGGGEWVDGETDAAVWTSPDGLTWARVPHDEAVFGGPGDQSMSSGVMAGGALVVVGGDDSGGDVDAAVWVSADGLTWSRVTHDEAVFGGSIDERMWWVTAGGPGLVAAGQFDTGGDRDGAIWLARPAG